MLLFSLMSYVILYLGKGPTIFLIFQQLNNIFLRKYVTP